MDRLAAHVIATAALTVTLATVPVLFADASHAATVSIPAHATTTAVTEQHPRLLFNGGPCADVHQVGQTMHEVYHGMTAFSVKEFYSPACHSYYGYSFAWLQFRDQHVRYDVGMAVYDVTHGAIDGARTFVGGAGGPDFWSAPVKVPHGTCVEGEGHYFYYPANSPYDFDEGDTLSTKVCA